MPLEQTQNAPVIANLKAGIQKQQKEEESARSSFSKLKDRLTNKKLEVKNPSPLIRSIDGEVAFRGVHPEIIERIWQLGDSLPTDSRAAVYGSPALVHPATDTILCFGSGTVYFLRLPEVLVAQAIEAGCFLHHKWTFGGEMDIQRELGSEWVGGRWLAAEPEWCRASYHHFGRL